MEDTLSQNLEMELQSQLASLHNKVKELEAQNAKLSSLLSNCRCHKMEESVDPSICRSNLMATEMKQLKLGSRNYNGTKKPKDRVSGTNFMHNHSQRFVALKVIYFGQRFYGFASEAQMDPTVESEIFTAFQKTRLIFGDKKSWQYSRCGRTDKGVSSVGQVIALFVRSNCKEQGVCPGNPEGELDYVRILNKALPKDIRIIGWCPVPVNFSARFSCLSRQYMYFFWRENLNILEMEIAGKKLLGEHDFRNFCKMDAANVHNYKRHITSFEVHPCNERFGEDQLWVIKIKGSAFLWHQVIDTLLDVNKTPRKPQYTMAPEIPLVLQSCEYGDLKFICSSDARQALQLHLERECRTYKLQASIYHEALLCSELTEDDGRGFSYRAKGKGASHVPLMSRPTEPSYEERRRKLMSETRNNPGLPS